MQILIHTDKQVKISMTSIGGSCWDTNGPFVVYRNFDLLSSMYEYSHSLPISKWYMILRMTGSISTANYLIEKVPLLAFLSGNEPLYSYTNFTSAVIDPL